MATSSPAPGVRPQRSGAHSTGQHRVAASQMQSTLAELYDDVQHILSDAPGTQGADTPAISASARLHASRAPPAQSSPMAKSGMAAAEATAEATPRVASAGSSSSSSAVPAYGPGNRRYGFVPTACQFCLQTEHKVERLRVCANCKSISYCSVAHQRADWPFHKKICKAKCSIYDEKALVAQAERAQNVDEWCRSRVAIINGLQMIQDIMQETLLNPVELEMITFARHCAVCYETKRDRLFDCKHCRMVSYCSAEHQQQHLVAHQRDCPRWLFALHCLQAKRMIATEELVCDTCLHLSRKLTFAVYPGTYPEFQEAWRNDYPGGKTPHLAVAFDSRLFGPWEQGSEDYVTDTITHLLDHGVPTLVTGRYRRCITAQHDALRKGDARFVLPVQANPFAGLVPHRIADLHHAGGEVLDHTNQFLAAFAGRQCLGTKSGPATPTPVDTSVDYASCYRLLVQTGDRARPGMHRERWPVDMASSVASGKVSREERPSADAAEPPV
ncbi:uncharacterized protein MONBRDRAFT_6441 [Monosiga brevicollis MX1]|uniref:MYND-type domain-containing protein n=1 Tax=Monosiga brevicollis TaxID=81824 RepID=A9UTV9_MONBE|nr:uncharacterized protein MONBRDRAFT_6441 [Monosiga brevicollis MX1]EDQ91561.1 predicted protein [Monosiga brevicollis MX1]|eukprot:XP_001743983.1 hypothetical protein [Monosiga brevicollis MX1]